MALTHTENVFESGSASGLVKELEGKLKANLIGALPQAVYTWKRSQNECKSFEL